MTATTEVAGRQITESDVAARLRLNGEWFNALSELAQEALVAQTAEQEGLSVSDAELQAAFDDFRLSQELDKAADTHNWLEASGVSVEQVETLLEAEILQSKLAEKLIDDAKIESYYTQNPQEFECAQISHIVIEDRGAAEEVALSAREEGEDFADLARKHSIDEASRAGGGFLGLITRLETGELPGEIADPIFAASVGDVIGPFEGRSGQIIARVEEVGRLPLDDSLRFSLRKQLFDRWLGEKAAG